jgi:hypothetical protein
MGHWLDGIVPKYWQQLQMALKDENDRLKMYSQKEINVVTNNDTKAGYDMILSNTGTAAKIIFSFKTDDPKVLAPLKGIRRVILLFCITPLIFAISFTFINALLSWRLYRLSFIYLGLFKAW